MDYARTVLFFLWHNHHPKTHTETIEWEITSHESNDIFDLSTACLQSSNEEQKNSFRVLLNSYSLPAIKQINNLTP